jgi:membrane protein
MVVKGYRLGPLLRKTAKEIWNDGVPDLAAQTAYYFFFSLFPLVLFLAPLASLFGDKRKLFGFILTQLERAVPADAYQLVAKFVQSVVFTPDAPGLVSIGALLALWSGSNIFSALITALNHAYHVKETRPWWKTKLLSILSVIVVGALFITATVVMLAGEDIVKWIADTLGLGTMGRWIWTILQFPLAFAILVGLAFLIYYFLPNVRQRKSHVLVGSVVATTLWLIVTMGFRFYVQNFANYNKTYGTIGAVIVALTWMYLSMFVLLAGGELNSELHMGTGAVTGRAGSIYNARITTEAATDDRTSQGSGAVA